jgi:L-ascorbate metabolism protein UlaG (beta-lactamase superfamily)
MAKILDLGHSCFQLEIAGKKFITDPFLRGNPLAKDIDFSTLEADYILVSHGHEDHIADLMELARQTKALVIANFEITTWVQNQGYDHVHGMNSGGSLRTEFGRIKVVRAEHSSSFPDGSYAGCPNGFVIEAEQACIYFAGDTALSYDQKLIGEEFDLDLAMLPIGDTFTMGVQDAIRAAGFVKCKTVVGMHYDTFAPIEIDHNWDNTNWSL